MCRSCNRDEKIQGSILSSAFGRANTHTFSTLNIFPRLVFCFWLSFYAKLYTQTRQKLARVFFNSMSLAAFLNSSTFFLLIIWIYLKVKSRICIKETHCNNDNRPFEKDWTYAWIVCIMWVNKIWVLSRFYHCSLSKWRILCLFSKKTCFSIQLSVFIVFLRQRKKNYCRLEFFCFKRWHYDILMVRVRWMF